jgi:hypothetical protein
MLIFLERKTPTSCIPQNTMCFSKLLNKKKNGDFSFIVNDYIFSTKFIIFLVNGISS